MNASRQEGYQHGNQCYRFGLLFSLRLQLQLKNIYCFDKLCNGPNIHFVLLFSLFSSEITSNWIIALNSIK
ncbi:hypothetical protein T4B_8678 [Trichinella pseudospiralis]|uniref:Uncharacterized protein n=1 Tax=Trichinella pseudospiralis TaxID=6337 RepID=A0A0V1ISU9_TRIPS|nr:hypothetical protein T4B_8678 [Trichinella pseudospiralis]